jgi:hypothetical protein
VNEALVVMLALIWAVVLLPGAIRSRRVNSQVTVGGFERAMDVLRRQPDGRYMMVPADASRIVSGDDAAADVRPRARREDPLIARRRIVFTRMIAGSGALFLAAVWLGGFAWTLFILSLVVTGGYVAVLRRHKVRRDEVRAVVRELRGDEPADRHQEPVPIAVGESPGIQVASRPDEPWQPNSGVRIRRWDA